MENHLTIKEAGRLLGVTPQTLRNWEKKGALIPYRNPVNNYRVYKVSQIEDFLEGMRTDRMKKSRFKLKVVSISE